LGIDPERVNVNGGAIALGHPLGCTGAKLTVQLMNEVQRRGSRYGMVTMCIGGGQGAAGIFTCCLVRLFTTKVLDVAWYHPHLISGGLKCCLLRSRSQVPEV
jgi:hypothetical protein